MEQDKTTKQEKELKIKDKKKKREKAHIDAETYVFLHSVIQNWKL